MPVKSLATMVKYDCCRHHLNTVSGRNFAAGFAQQIEMHDIHFAGGL